LHGLGTSRSNAVAQPYDMRSGHSSANPDWLLAPPPALSLGAGLLAEPVVPAASAIGGPSALPPQLVNLLLLLAQQQEQDQQESQQQELQRQAQDALRVMEMSAAAAASALRALVRSPRGSPLPGVQQQQHAAPGGYAAACAAASGGGAATMQLPPGVTALMHQLLEAQQEHGRAKRQRL
jgi:hypothetical protein